MDLNSSLESQTPKFNSIDDECAHWKKLAHELANKFADTKQEYTEFMENSKELESELETTLEQREKTIRDLKGNLNQIQNDNESLRRKLNDQERDYLQLEKNFEQVKGELELLREHTRKIEQKNDDIERSNRILTATVDDLEAMLNQAYEKNEFLELEVEDKESLSEKHQRVLDELRDLKQEIKVKNQPLNQSSPAIHSESVLNGNTPPIASQKAFSIIADSLRRIDIMAAKLKACQEIQLHPNMRPTADVDRATQQRRHHLISDAVTTKSPSMRYRYSSINNGTLNHTNVGLSQPALTNTTTENSLLAADLSLITK